MFSVGDRVRLLKQIEQSYMGEYPDQILGSVGDVGTIREINGPYAPKNGITIETDRWPGKPFWVNPEELELAAT